MPSGSSSRSRTTSLYSRPGDVRDQPAEDPVAGVGVLEARAGRPGEGQPPREEPAELVEVEALLAVAPRIVGREAGGHREEVADRDRRRVRSGVAQARELRHVAVDPVIEREPALVAQRQDGRGREALGHRGDPEDRGRASASRPRRRAASRGRGCGRGGRRGSPRRRGPARASRRTSGPRSRRRARARPRAPEVRLATVIAGQGTAASDGRDRAVHAGLRAAAGNQEAAGLPTASGSEAAVSVSGRRSEPCPRRPRCGSWSRSHRPRPRSGC